MFALLKQFSCIRKLSCTIRFPKDWQNSANLPRRKGLAIQFDFSSGDRLLSQPCPGKSYHIVIISAKFEYFLKLMTF